MVFFSFRIFFSDNTRVRIFVFFVVQNANFFLQNLTLCYMTKTLNQIIFFSSTKIRIFFQKHWESKYFFRKKTHSPPPPPPLEVKWSVPKANSVFAAIRTFKYLNVETFLPIYKTLLRTHLECSNSVWAPYKMKHIYKIEGVQKRATKQIPGLGNLSSPKRFFFYRH